MKTVYRDGALYIFLFNGLRFTDNSYRRRVLCVLGWQVLSPAGNFLYSDMF